MSLVFRWTLTGLGLAFFLIHVLIALSALRVHADRRERLEAFGRIAPGLAGLLVAVGGWLIPSMWALLPILLALPTLVVGRAAYELLVFGRRRVSRDAH